MNGRVSIAEKKLVKIWNTGRKKEKTYFLSVGIAASSSDSDANPLIDDIDDDLTLLVIFFLGLGGAKDAITPKDKEAPLVDRPRPIEGVVLPRPGR